MEASHYILSGLIAIIFYFLKDFYSSNKAMKEKIIQIDTKIALLENNHNHLSDTIKQLSISIEKLAIKVDELKDTIHELKQTQ
jgi:peptidoglycan hydrolase CwlO-like protein